MNSVSLGLDKHEWVEDLSLCAYVCGSAHDCGYVVDGSNAMVAS